MIIQNIVLNPAAQCNELVSVQPLCSALMRPLQFLTPCSARRRCSRHVISARGKVRFYQQQNDTTVVFTAKLLVFCNIILNRELLGINV